MKSLQTVFDRKRIVLCRFDSIYRAARNLGRADCHHYRGNYVAFAVATPFSRVRFINSPRRGPMKVCRAGAPPARFWAASEALALQRRCGITGRAFLRIAARVWEPHRWAIAIHAAREMVTRRAFPM